MKKKGLLKVIAIACFGIILTWVFGVNGLQDIPKETPEYARTVLVCAISMFIFSAIAVILVICLAMWAYYDRKTGKHRNIIHISG